MQRVRVKIEGLREPATAVKIAQMGADCIGMVFAESPRWVSPQQAREICDALPPWVATVGVFVNSDSDTVNRVVERSRIQYVQLHGDEPAAIVTQIDAPCIKAFRVRDEQWLPQVRTFLAELAALGGRLAAVLLDAYDPAVRGGSGQAFNWEMVADARMAGQLAGIDPIILAGGLDSRNVERAVELVKPWAVDVASGVEKAPGVKDLKKVADFIRAANEGNELKSEFWR